MTVGEVRVPFARLIVAAAAALAGVVILLLARGFNFYFDEWDFILATPDATWTTYLQPHNEHLVLIPKLIYASLLSAVGLGTYMPYMAVLLVLHGLNVLLVFELVRRRSGDLVGFGAAALLLLLGAGWENLLWAFQVAFVGAVTCGLAALLILERPRSTAVLCGATALTAAALLFSGVGIFFAIAVAVRLAVEPERRRDLAWLVPVAAAFLAWYLVFGHQGVPTSPPPTPRNLLIAPIYALWGMGAAAAGLFGESGWWVTVSLILAVGAVAFSWWRSRPDAVSIAVAAGLVSFYLVTGLGRAQFGYDQSGAGRYVYEGAVFWVLLLSDAARGLPWRGTWRPALVACIFLATFNSAALLVEYAAAKTAQMQRENADLQALDSVRNDPCLAPGGSPDPLVMPQLTRPALYYRAVDMYGDPAPSGPVTDSTDYARARTNLERSDCR